MFNKLVVTAKPISPADNLCNTCAHAAGSWDYCAKHERTTAEIKDQVGHHLLINILCTGYHRKPGAARQDASEGQR